MPIRRRSTFVRLAIGTTALATAACSSGTSGTSVTSADGGGASAKGALVQVIDSVPTPAIAGIDKGYRQGATELGVNVQVSQSNGDVTKDIANVQDAVAKGAKGLLIVPLSIDAVRPALKQAVEAGVCVGVAYSDITEGHEITPGIKTYFGTDNEEGARNLVDQMAKKMGDKGGIVYVGGVASFSGTQIIERSIKDQLAKMHPGITYLGGQPADYDQAKARTVTQDFVQRYGDQITGVVTAADSMGETVADYIDKSKLSGKVTIGSFSGYTPFVELIKQGKAFATVPQPLVDDGARAMKRIAECIEGNKDTVFDRATTLPSMQPLKATGFVLTADNVNAYTPQY